jgi:predicted ATP-dependent endonuclease of OLD family
MQIDNLWFFGNSKEPAIVSITLYFDPNEVGGIINTNEFQEIKGAKLEVKLERAREKVRLKLNKLSLLGYVTISSKKADEILKSQDIEFKENCTESKIVENSYISNDSLFKRFLPILIGKVHYINMYENVPQERYTIKGLVSSILPQNLREELEILRKDHIKYIRSFYGKYSKIVTGSDYTPSLERGEEGNYFRYDFFGGGDQTIDSLVAKTLNKGQNHIFLLEEPELHLHPSYIKRFGRLIEELVREEKIQIIIVTHSPFLVRYLKDIKKSLYIVKKTKTYVGFPFERELPSTKVLQLQDIGKKEFPESFLRRDLFFSEVLILVEGCNDEIIIRECIRLLQNDLRTLSRLYYKFIYYAEKNLEEVLNFTNEIAQFMDIPQFIIADGDEEGKKKIEIALNKGFNKDENAFNLESEDIFFTIKKKGILNEAVKEVLMELKNRVENEKTKEIIEDKLQSIKEKEVENKNDLERIFSDIEKEVRDWRIHLANVIIGKIKINKEDLGKDIIDILKKIDMYLEKINILEERG